MTPTWHTGHKAASTPFLATQPIAPRRLRALLVTRARRGVPRACPLLPSLPRTRRFAPTSPRVRAHCSSMPRGRRPAPPTGERAPIPPRFLPPRAVRFNLHPLFLAKNVDLWQSAPAPRERRGLISPLLSGRKLAFCLLAVPSSRGWRESHSRPVQVSIFHRQKSTFLAKIEHRKIQTDTRRCRQGQEACKWSPGHNAPEFQRVTQAASRYRRATR